VDITPILRKSKEAARSEQRAKGGVAKSGPIGGLPRVVRGGRGRGGHGGDGGRGRKRSRYEDDGNAGGSRGKFGRYSDRSSERVSTEYCSVFSPVPLSLSLVQGQVTS